MTLHVKLGVVVSVTVFWVSVVVGQPLPLMESDLKQGIVDHITKKLMKEYPELSTKDVKVTLRNPENLRKIPSDAHTYRIPAKQRSTVLGNTVQRIYFYDADGREIANQYYMINAVGHVTVYRAKSVLPKGAVVQASDVVESYESMYGMPRNRVNNLSDIIGKETLSTVSLGSLFLSRSVRAVPVVRRGDRVAVHLKGSNLRLKVGGVAMEDGMVGSTIRIKSNVYSRKILEGEIIDSQNVQVHFIN